MVADTKAKFSALPARIFTAVALVALIVTISWLGQPFFTLLAALAAVILLHEWSNITPHTRRPLWLLFGACYIALPCAALVGLYETPSLPCAPLPFMSLVYLLCVIAATDTGAYFAGKLIGGPKLLPAISPNKTWAGLLGGMTAAAAVSFAWQPYVTAPHSTLSALCLGATLALLAQTGDYFESWLKRRAGVKDSGKILPGHGGLFDRVDGLMLTAPFYLWMIYSTQGSV